MKKAKLLAFTLALAFALIGASANAANEKRDLLGKAISEQKAIHEQVASLDFAIKRVTDQITEIRRDQLNYRLDKELLKDAYASNLQVINIGLTGTLGMFTIIGALFGFFGLKSIGALKDKYAEELVEFRRLKGELESDLARVRDDQKRIQTEVASLANTNHKQEDRLQVLELQEKVGQLIGQRLYLRALEYVNIGLGLAPKDDALLGQKAKALSLLSRFPEAADVAKERFEIDRQNSSNATDLAEFLLLAGRTVEFDAHIGQYAKAIEAQKGAICITYLRALKSLRQDSGVEMKELLTQFKPDDLDQLKPRMSPFDFNDLDTFLPAVPDSKSKKLFMAFTLFLRGATNYPTVQEALQAIG